MMIRGDLEIGQSVLIIDVQHTYIMYVRIPCLPFLPIWQYMRNRRVCPQKYTHTNNINNNNKNNDNDSNNNM